jgi:hypothetical protein
MNHPSNLVTDYLLFGQATIFGWSMRKEFLKSRNATHFCWSIAFFFLGLASLAGGTFHGFEDILDSRVAAALWKITIYSVGAVSLFLLIGNAYASVGLKGRKIFQAIGGVKSLLFAFWMIFHNEFVFVIVEYASAMILVMGLLLQNSNRSAGRLIIAGILVSFLGAGLQQTGVVIHEYFNANDIYHLIQLGANVLLWKGALQLSDFVPQVVPQRLA